MTLANGVTADIVFSEVLSASSKTAVQTALDTGAFEANKPTYSWTGATLTITGGVDGTTFKNDVTSNITDVAGNTGTTATSANYTIDTRAPTASIALSDSALKIGETSTVTVTFSEAVTGFTNADLQVVSAPQGANTTVTVTAVSPTVYTVSLGGMTVDGVYSLSVPANAAVDQANTGNLAAPSPAVVARGKEALKTLAP